MRGTSAGIRQRAVLGEDARFKECLYQGEDALVPDPLPHPVHKSRMRDFVEGLPDLLRASMTAALRCGRGRKACCAWRRLLNC